MEPNTSSKSVSGSHEVERDVNNLIDNIAGLGCNEEGPFHDVPIVIFDLDTTKRSTTINEISQIAAWCGGNTFNECMLPENGISQDVSVNNGFSIIGGTLHHYGNEVNALSPIEGLVNFLDFLQNQTGQTRGVLLAAHSCFSIHRYVIVRLMRKYELFDTFRSLVLGFIDTIPVFKTIFIERAQARESFSLENLAIAYLGENAFPEQPHAVVNVEILVSLIDTIECTDAMLAQRAESLDEFIRFIDLKHVFGNVLTKYMLNKIARAGISVENMEEEYSANGAGGISIFLQEEVAGHPRVTNSLTVIANINARLSELFGNGNGN